MNIYIGNLSLETTEDELRKEFIKFGQVLSITLMNDKYIGSGQPRGYGYIQMGSREDAANAIANLSGKTFRGNVVSITLALPLTKHTIKAPETSGSIRSLKSRERTV